MKNNFSRFFLLVLSIFLFVQLFEFLAEFGDKKSEEDKALHEALAASVKTTPVTPTSNKSSASKPLVTKTIPKPPKVLRSPDLGCRLPIPESEIKTTLKLLSKSLRYNVKQVRAGLVFDVDNKSILWQKDIKRAVPIASMTKMMTCLLMLEKIEKGELNLNQKYKVTKTCMKAKPSKVWLDTRETPTLEALSRAMMIKSANDAAWLVSEIVAGDAAKFVQSMNRHAAQLNMKSFRFYNANGLPEGASRRNNLGCPLDLTRLAELLLHYPDAVRWTSTKVDKFDTDFRKEPFILVNNNRLLGNFPGVTGMKTGFTNAAMFCSTVTCTQNGRTMIVVLTGMGTSRGRDKLIAELLTWAFKQN